MPRESVHHSVDSVAVTTWNAFAGGSPSGWLLYLTSPQFGGSIMYRRFLTITSVFALLALSASSAFSQRANYEEAPISYSVSAPDNRVSQLQTQLDSGEKSLTFEEGRGYLRSLLDALEISPVSQVMSFSRTSLQNDLISPTTPRALYFNDEVHLGFVQNGLIEIAVRDPGLGMVFYTLKQTNEEPPLFRRQTNSCLTCHGAARTRNVPGLLVRSVYPDSEGHPVVSAGSFVSTHRSPLHQRWGGWYVTGTHGDQQHLGNFSLATSKKPKVVDNTGGQNVTDLKERFDTSPYLTPHSDIVALMVLEHQTDMYNVLTQASFEIRHALFLQEKAISEDADAAAVGRELLTTRLKKSSDLIAKSLLFSEEARLTAPILGTSEFGREFTSRGPKDSSGRSLRDFDLRTRMFCYPCSYLIQTPAFEALPLELKAAVGSRMREILTSSESLKGFEHLSQEDRQAIIEILQQTKPGFL